MDFGLLSLTIVCYNGLIKSVESPNGQVDHAQVLIHIDHDTDHT